MTRSCNFGSRWARGALVLFAIPVVAAAQTSEVWPELDTYWRPAKRHRTMLELSASTEREGVSREATIGLYQDHLRLPWAFFRAGYRFTFSTEDASHRESRGVLEANVTACSVKRARVVNRLRGELRLVNGEYSYRLRERIHAQLVATSHAGRAWAPYGTVEAYYDSRFATIARIGGRIGTEGRIGGPATFDLFIARQENSRSEPKFVNALGMIVRLTYGSHARFRD